MPEQNVERHVRSHWSLPVFATLATFAFLMSSLSPHEAIPARAVAPAAEIPAQALVVTGVEHPGAARDEFEVTRIRVAPATAPAAGVPDPGTAQAIAYDMVLARGWSDAEFDCLVALWNRESHWNVYAHNTRSGAYGIPAGAPRRQDGDGGRRLADQPRDADHVGARLHRGPLRAPRAAPGRTARPRAGTERAGRRGSARRII